MRKIVLYISAFLALFSCSEESSLVFYEDNFIMEENAIIEINIPKAEGTSDVANKINSQLEDFVVNALTQNKNATNSETIQEAAQTFNTEYMNFATNLDEEAQPWEAFIDGEITLESSEVISIALNNYLNTGGIHGNSVISFMNFDPSSGEIYDYTDIIEHLEDLRALVSQHLKKAISEEIDATEILSNYQVVLPETLGFN